MVCCSSRVRPVYVSQLPLSVIRVGTLFGGGAGEVGYSASTLNIDIELDSHNRPPESHISIHTLPSHLAYPIGIVHVDRFPQSNRRKRKKPEEPILRCLVWSFPMSIQSPCFSPKTLDLSPRREQSSPILASPGTVIIMSKKVRTSQGGIQRGSC